MSENIKNSVDSRVHLSENQVESIFMKLKDDKARYTDKVLKLIDRISPILPDQLVNQHTCYTAIPAFVLKDHALGTFGGILSGYT